MDAFDRTTVGFAQAEGREALPPQLKTKELSESLRAYLWRALWKSVEKSLGYTRNVYPRSYYIVADWKAVLSDWWVDKLHKFIDEFDNDLTLWKEYLKEIFAEGDYIDVFDFLQFCLRHPSCPYELEAEFTNALKQGKAAYRIAEKTIFPISSEIDAQSIEHSFAILKESGLDGARSHLKTAGEALSQGKWADSVRESIHAVESALKLLEPSERVLSRALVKLEKDGSINSNLKRAMNALYDFTSDEDGVRHAKVLADTKVGEAEAMYMFGACAAFLSFVSLRMVEAAE